MPEVRFYSRVTHKGSGGYILKHNMFVAFAKIPDQSAFVKLPVVGFGFLQAGGDALASVRKVPVAVLSFSLWACLRAGGSCDVNLRLKWRATMFA